MTRSSVTPMSRVLLATGLAVVGIIAGAACTKEVEVPVPGTPTVIREVVPGTPTVIREVVPGTPTVIREVVPGTPTVIREVVPTVVVTEVPVEVTKEVPMTLSDLAQAIEEGEIDVGTQYGLAFGQRYHTIHTTTLGLECATCHIANPDTIQTVFSAQDVSPQAPGAVDKRACLGCHRAGPGDELYDSGGP